MSAPELSRIVKLKAIQHEPVVISASDAERAALAQRFGISAISDLRAEITLDPDGRRVAATGMITADVIQPCAISGEDFPVSIEDELELAFVPAGQIETSEEDAEIELERDQLDEIEYEGDSFDLGEAVAQSLALAIDPYAEGPNADAAREKAGIVSEDAPSGPLAEALKGLMSN